MRIPASTSTLKTVDSCPPRSRWLHRAVSKMQVSLYLPDDLPSDQVKRRFADVLASLENPPTHADFLIANQLREQVRNRYSIWSQDHDRPGNHPKIALVLDVIRKRHADPTLRLTHAADAAELSPWYLARLLVRLTGSGFAEHLRRTRVSAAERLLATTALSIKEVAYAIGYGSSGAFDRAFRQVHALTPLEWKRQHVPQPDDSSGENPHIK